jgi:acyl-CoA thioesterase FadM
MNLYLRLMLAMFAAWRLPALGHEETSECRFRVWPHDIDLFGHMNNGRYLQIMDVARMDWMLRTGVINAMRSNRWGAVLGGGVVRFRRSLKPLQAYRVRTRLICWDERWFYHEHTFLNSNGNCVAVGITRAALRGGGDWVATRSVVQAVSEGAVSPPVPAYLAELLDAEEAMFRAGEEVPRRVDALEMEVCR